MKLSNLIISCVATLALAGGANTFASPSPRVIADIQADVKVLGARIENAIADLVDDRTTENIKGAAVQVLDSHDYDRSIKISALNMVIENAVLAEDELVVGALKSIELNTFDLRKEPEVRTDSDDMKVTNAPISKVALSKPPSASATGGSDY